MKKLLYLLVACGFFAFAAPALAANGTITGTVTHAVGGTAVDSIFLNVVNVDTNVATYAVADETGAYTVSVAPGTYDVSPSTSVSAEPGVTFIQKTVTATVTSGATTSGTNFVLTRRAKFSGHVYAADGVTPISNAVLYITNMSSSDLGYGYAVTSSTGSYVSAPIPDDASASAPGTYTFTVSRFGYYSSTVSNVTLGADETSVTQNFTMTAGSTVTGTITNASGSAVAGATVTVVLKNTPTPYYATYTATTSAAGTYTVSVFSASSLYTSAKGDYSVSISKDGYVTKTDTISITAESSTNTNNYTLATGKILSGTVRLDRTTTGISGVTVSLFKRNAARSDTPSFTTTTASDGTFSFTTLPNGNYRVSIAKAKYVTKIVDSVSITKDKTGVIYNVSGAGTIQGKVHTGASTAVDGATITMYALKNGKYLTSATTTTDEDGNYTINTLKSGSYRVVVTTTDFVKAVDNVVLKSNSTKTKNFKLTAAGSVDGTITDSVTGLPVAATIKVVGTSIIAYSNSNGYYVIDGLPAGKRKLTVLHSFYQGSGQKEVTVKVNSTKTGVDFSLKPL